MQENQLQIKPTGVWIQTSIEKIHIWRARVTDVLTTCGYQMVQSIPLTDCFHQSFERDYETLVVNTFKNGAIQISTKDIDKLFEYIIPYLETKLGVTFDCDPDDEEYIMSISHPRIEPAATSSKKTSRKASEGFNVKFSEEDVPAGVVMSHKSGGQHQSVKDMMEERFLTTKRYLDNHDDVGKGYQRCCTESFCPLYNHLYKYGYKDGRFPLLEGKINTDSEKIMAEVK